MRYLCCEVNGVYKCGVCKIPYCNDHLRARYVLAPKKDRPTCRECNSIGMWVNMVDRERGRRQQERIDNLRRANGT